MNRPIHITTFDNNSYLDTDLPAGMTSLITPKVEVFPTVENVPPMRSKNVIPILSRGSSFNQAKSSSGFPTFPKIDVASPINAGTNSNAAIKSSTQLSDALRSPQFMIQQPEQNQVRLTLENLETVDAEEFDRELEAPSLAYLGGGGKTPIASPCKKSMSMVAKTNSSLAKFSDEHTPRGGSRNIQSSNMQWDDVEVSFQPRDGYRKQSELVPTRTLLPSYKNGYYYDVNGRYDPNYIPNILGRTKTYLLNDKILENVLVFLDSADLVSFSKIIFEYRNDKKYKMKFKNRLFKLLLQGLSDQDQYGFWNAFMNFKQLKKERPTAFTQHFVRVSSFIKDIRKDVDRTFPEIEKYSTEHGKASLLRVLVAVSNSITELGYMQGLNYVAGVFLYYLKEEQAFWATLYLLEKLNAKDLLKENFKTIHLLNYQFEVFLTNYLPAVSNHLNGQPVNISYITTPWFITLYSYHLSLPKIVKLWNFYFIRGKSFLIQFGLAIFSIYESSILSMDQDEVPIFLKNQLNDLSDNDNSIFERALEFKVTKQMLEDIVPFYQQGKPKLTMQRDSRDKVRWQPSSPLASSKSVANLDRNDNLSRNRSSPLRLNRTLGMSQTVIVGKGDETPSRMRALLDSVKQLDISDSIKNIFKRSDNQSRTEFSSNTSSNNSPTRMKDSRMINISQDQSTSSHHLTQSPASPFNRNFLKNNDLYIDESEENSPNLKTKQDETFVESPVATKRFEAVRKEQSAGKLKSRMTTSEYQYTGGNASISDFSPLEKTSTLRRTHMTASIGKLPTFGFTSNVNGNTTAASQRLDERYMSIISLSKIEPSFNGQRAKLIDGERTIELDIKNKSQVNGQLSGSGRNSPDYRPKVYPRGASSIIN